MPTIIYERSEVSVILKDDVMYDVEVTNEICTRTDRHTLNGKEMIDFIDKFVEDEIDDCCWSIEFTPKEYFILVEDADPECIGFITPTR